ncbi:MAG: ABC transporter ATP-binding protein [Wenzhouxiangellaceae bacterium]|nr:ABC transporter ATP-binding protein [Wenzhouxiangellaceae bacterium]
MLAVEAIELGYDGPSVVRNLSFSLERGEIGCLLGASGCGKTTALRAIAGFEPLRAGRILIDGRPVSEPDRIVPPERRGIGMVFQDHALFPHLTVADNIGFGLRRLGRERRSARVGELLELTGLSGMEARYPHELSGGQQQRVAVARALAPAPAVLLMDEPFSNLDTGLRRQMGDEIREMLKARGTATLMVTHDQQEAFALADRVGLMCNGRMLQWDSPYQLYHRPICRYVAAFTGRGSYIRARIEDGELLHALGRSPVPEHVPADAGEELELLIRPDDIRPDPGGPRARVTARQFQGADILYRLELPGGEEVGALFPSHDNYAEGESIGIVLDADHLVLFDPRQSAAIESSA